MLCKDQAGQLELVLVRLMLRLPVEVPERATPGAALVLVDVLAASRLRLHLAMDRNAHDSMVAMSRNIFLANNINSVRRCISELCIISHTCRA